MLLDLYETSFIMVLQRKTVIWIYVIGGHVAGMGTSTTAFIIPMPQCTT